MLTKESLDKAREALATCIKVGFSLEELFDPERMSETRKIAVAMAVTGEFDDEVSELINHQE